MLCFGLRFWLFGVLLIWVSFLVRLFIMLFWRLCFVDLVCSFCWGLVVMLFVVCIDSIVVLLYVIDGVYCVVGLWLVWFVVFIVCVCFPWLLIAYLVWLLVCWLLDSLFCCLLLRDWLFRLRHLLAVWCLCCWLLPSVDWLCLLGIGCRCLLLCLAVLLMMFIDLDWVLVIVLWYRSIYTQ